jgi:dihydrofolate synthase/folylpolyglutamate synthase
MDYLGNTLSKIAFNKAGIIKKTSVVVTTNQDEEVMKVIEDKCQHDENKLFIADIKNTANCEFKNLQINFDYNDLKQIEINLAGNYQIQNAVLAIEVVRALARLGYLITDETIRKGLKATKWFGRFSKICDEPLIIIDGAHNEAAAIQLRETIECYFNNKKLMFVIGVLGDKEYEKIASITATLADKILTVTTPNNPRALNGKDLAQTIRRYNPNVEYIPTIEEAATRCMKEGNPYDAIIVFGSLSYLGEFASQVEAMKGGN